VLIGTIVIIKLSEG